MSRFVFHSTSIDDLVLIERQQISDSRGFLERLFCQDEFTELLKGGFIRQINRTLTQKSGTVRGLHFQYPPNAEIKIISCLKGKVWDVAVDLREGSPTFLKYFGVLLTEDNRLSYLIPEGFAHGFQTLTSNCELLYFHTADFKAEAEGGLNALDPRLAIEWPEPIMERSERDLNHAPIADHFQGIQFL